ncbi:MAG TPA: hypothetical protein VD865_11445 [Stenotrophomonas sp.]|nr:hypothetical protein [Stenotrophomonas sp.]
MSGYTGFATYKKEADKLFGTRELARETTAKILHALATGAKSFEVNGMIVYTEKPEQE